MQDRGVGRKNFLPLSLFPFSLSFHSCASVCVCVCVCVLLAASILNVVDGSLKLKKGSLNSGPIEFFLWKKNTIVESWSISMEGPRACRYSVFIVCLLLTYSMMLL